MEARVLEKWKNLIDAAKSYWIENRPTGYSDAEFDLMEKRAIEEDEFYVRDYVFSLLSGEKVLNRDIDKITKYKVNPKSTMLDAIWQTEKELGRKLYWDFKYDGSSIAIHLDPQTGRVLRLVSCGNLSINDYGHDRTTNLYQLVPSRFRKGIRTIQCEALIDLSRFKGNPDRARQSSNGLVNSKYCEEDIFNLLTLRAYRYWADPSTSEGREIEGQDYRDVLTSFPIIYKKFGDSGDNHITFAPADVWTSEELGKMSGFTEGNSGVTTTGSFLRDGFVAYNDKGVCQRALKYSGAGSESERIKSTVRSIQWNNQSSKGKDSWSANVIIDPVKVRGCIVSKPSAGSVSKLIKNNITPGAEVSIIMANSTIPMVGDVIKPGNGNFMWPTCDCGYKLGPSDIFGSLLKCGNPKCSDRLDRMIKYLKSLKSIIDLDLNKYLVIDRFRWENTEIDLGVLLGYVEKSNLPDFYKYLDSFLNTKLQKQNLVLVYQAGYRALRELYEQNTTR